MRILHTSDWHLGLMSGRASRAPEHERFLSWLCDQISEYKVDTLVVAGDIFDGIQPSAEAQRLYYGFLRRLESTGLAQAVIVGGNHDSAAQLEAPRELLESLHIHVVGGYSREEDASRYLIPLLRRGATVPTAICVALPYIHEWRLGVRTTDPDVRAVRREFSELFENLYSRLADEAERRYPQLPLLATGHLTVGQCEAGDFPQEIHRVGTIDALPASLFDARFRYIALGHIHRSFPVEKGRIWYSGSPIAVSVVEARRPRQVLLVDLPDDGSLACQVQPLAVPCFRELIEMRGSEEQVVTQIRALQPKLPLAPYLYVSVAVTAPEPQLGTRVRQELANLSWGEPPELVELREQLANSPAADGVADELIQLEDLAPAQVFARLCEARSLVPDAHLLAAFDTVVGASKEEWAEMISALETGKSRVLPAEGDQGEHATP